MARRPSFAQARQRYPNRFTMEHVPDWARRRPVDDGGTLSKFYAPQFRSDREWYEHTLFPGESGHPGDPHHCFTTGQTWPLGQWFDQPFHPTMQ